jgi:DNA-binding NarL/FixJ family response regulator
VGTEELGGATDSSRSDYWQFVAQLGVVSQLALPFRDDVRIIGNLLLNRIQGQEPFTQRDRARLLRMHPLLESGFVLAESHVTIADRVAGVYGRELTPREREVALLVARGASNKQVADTL